MSKQFYLGKAAKIPIMTRPDSDNRLVLWLTVTKNNQDFTIATTHFTWTADGRPNPKQRRNLKKMLNILGGMPEFIISGDFNAPRQYSTYQILAGKFIDRVPKNVATTIDPQLHYANKEKPGQLAIVVDHLFTTKHYQAKVKVRCGLSDHCALIAQVKKQLPPGPG